MYAVLATCSNFFEICALYWYENSRPQSKLHDLLVMAKTWATRPNNDFLLVIWNPQLANLCILAFYFAHERVRQLLTVFISISMTLILPFLVAQCNALYLHEKKRHMCARWLQETRRQWSTHPLKSCTFISQNSLPFSTSWTKPYEAARVTPFSSTLNSW